MAHEDAIDQFEEPYYTTISASTTSPSATSVDTLCNSRIPTFPPSSPALSLTPAVVHQPAKVLLIVPGASNSIAGTNINRHPLDFAQVFGKLPSTTTGSTTGIFNSPIVKELSPTQQVFARLVPSIEVNEQKPEQTLPQELACDKPIIKVKQGTNKTMKLPPEVLDTGEIGDQKSNLFGGLTFSLKNATLVQCNNGSIPTTLPPPPPSSTSSSKLADIFIETSREAMKLEGADSDAVQNTSIIGTGEAGLQIMQIDPVVSATTVDPMVILSQAVSLQKVVIYFQLLISIYVSSYKIDVFFSFKTLDNIYI